MVLTCVEVCLRQDEAGDEGDGLRSLAAKLVVKKRLFAEHAAFSHSLKGDVLFVLVRGPCEHGSDGQ